MFKQQSSKHSLFLLELIIAILFFTISSAVCVQLYAKAHVLSTSTKDLNIAMAKAESVAELIKSNPIDPQIALVNAIPSAQIIGKSFLVGYNQDWAACPVAEAYSILKIDWEQEDQMLSATISIYYPPNADPLDEETIYSLRVDKQIPNTLK